MAPLSSYPSIDNAKNSQVNSSLGNPFDLLKTILDTVNNSQQVQQQSSSLAAQDKTIQQRNAYQKGIESALKKTGEQHTIEALQQGVSPDHIIQQSGIGDNQQQNPQDILAKLVNQGISTSGFTTSDIPNQAIQTVDPNGRSVMGNILNTLGNFTGINPMNAAVDSLRLSNMGQAQNIASGQPATIGLPQAQIKELEQKISGAVPLQPAEVARLNIDSYTAALQANQQAYANSNTEIQNLNQTLNILQQGRSTVGKAFGENTDIMKALKQVIAAKVSANANIAKNQKVLMNNAPQIKSNGEESSSNSGFKVIGVR